MSDNPSPAEYWNPRLAPGVSRRDAYEAVSVAVRAMLSAHPQFKNSESTTTEVVEALYPEAEARGDGIAARQVIFKALAALAERDLKDCCYKGPPRRAKFGMIRPWVWHAPRRPTCPHCGGELAA